MTTLADHLVVRLHRNTLHFLQQEIDAGDARPENGEQDQRSVELLRAAVVLHQLLRAVVQVVGDRFSQNRIDDYTAEGRQLTALFDTTQSLLENIRAEERRSRGEGQAVGGLEQIDSVLADVRRWRADLLDHWPWFSEEDMVEARAAEARGELLDLDEAFAGIAGVEKQVWLERIAAHRRANGDGPRS